MRTSSYRRLFALSLTAAVSVFGTACESNGPEGGSDEASAVGADEQVGEAEREEIEKRETNEPEQGAAANREAGESGDETAETATVGGLAPEFTLEDTDGEEHSLSDYRGEYVVLEWTSTECPFVKRHYEEETFETALETFREEDVEVQWLAVDSSHFAEPNVSKQWKDEYGVDYPFLMDPSGEVGKKYGAKTTPHMYVIGPEGKVRYTGAIDDDPDGRKDSPKNYVTRAVRALGAGDDVEPSSTEPYGCSVKYEG